MTTPHYYEVVSKVEINDFRDTCISSIIIIINNILGDANGTSFKKIGCLVILMKYAAIITRNIIFIEGMI